MERVERSRLLGGLVALLAVAGIIVLSMRAVSAPDPVAGNAPADQFSAERAFAQVEQIGSAVHPTGSAAADDVRAYIVRTLNQLGISTRVQDDIGADEPYNYARVRNVVAMLPGTEPTGRVFLFAHYDSASASFGASDDGIGVAVLLDVARALTAEPKPRNDIVFVLTDGEESCLCGAEAFARSDPAAADGGVFLNFDNRGSSGPGIMYRTSPGNSALIAIYQAAVPYPWASGFAAEVNQRLPGDTDFSALIHSGKFVGFDTAQIDASAIYHTPQDRPEYVDMASLQHVGANALALSRALAAADLAPLLVDSGSDASYFSAFSVVISYPVWLIGPLAGLAVLAIVALALLARRRGMTGWPRLSAGLALTLVPMVLGPAVAQLLWIILVAVRPGYANMLDPWQPGWFRAAVFAFVVAIVLAWYGLFRRRVGPWGLIIAGLGWLAGLGVVLAVVAPSGSYLLTLPSLAGSAGCAVALLARRPAIQLVALVAGAGVGIVILLPMLLALFAAVGLTLGMVPAFVVVLLALVILPVFERIYPEVARRTPDEAVVQVRTVRSPARRRWCAAAPSLAAVLLGGSLVITGLAVDRFDPAHPAPVQLNYILDADTGHARWFSDDEHPDPWVAQFVTGQPNSHAEFWPLDDGVPTGAAQAANLTAPMVTVLADTSSDGQRTITVNITPQRSSNRLWLALPDVLPTRATVAGREVQMAELEGQFFVAFYGSPTTGIDVHLVLPGTDPTKLRVGDNSQGLDGIPGYVPRPAGLGLTGARGSDIVTVGKTYTL